MAATWTTFAESGSLVQHRGSREGASSHVEASPRLLAPGVSPSAKSSFRAAPPKGFRVYGRDSSSVSSTNKNLIRVSDHEASPSPSCAPPEVEGRVEELLGQLKWDTSSGLLVAMAQNADTGQVMMQGFADRKAVAQTLLTGRATFFSRSRKALWTKGEVSGNFIRVLEVFADCDRDALIYWGLPDGPTCHTGEVTCFFETLHAADSAPTPAPTPLSTIFAVERTILERQQQMEAQEDKGRPAVAPTSDGAGGGGSGTPEVSATKSKKPSWTHKLLTNPELLCSKIREEADELCRTLEQGEGKERAASEMADLLYHALVLLRVQGVTLEEVAAVLRGRFGVSGIEEKASRARPSP